MTPPIFWDGSPPSTPRHTTQVFTVPKGARCFIRFLGDIQGVWLHWLPKFGPRGRTLPHLEADCPHCPDRHLRWKGYTPAERWVTNRQTGKGEWQQFVAVAILNASSSESGASARAAGAGRADRPAARAAATIQNIADLTELSFLMKQGCLLKRSRYLSRTDRASCNGPLETPGSPARDRPPSPYRGGAVGGQMFRLFKGLRLARQPAKPRAARRRDGN